MPISKSLSKNQELLDLMKQANELHDAVVTCLVSSDQ